VGVRTEQREKIRADFANDYLLEVVPGIEVIERNPNAAMYPNVDGMDRHALNFAPDAQAYAPSG
jgi:hypothetical protein